MKGKEDEVGEDYVFKFIVQYVCNPMKKGFEDIIQYQRATYRRRI